MNKNHHKKALFRFFRSRLTHPSTSTCPCGVCGVCECCGGVWACTPHALGALRGAGQTPLTALAAVGQHTLAAATEVHSHRTRLRQHSTPPRALDALRTLCCAPCSLMLK